MNNLTTRKIVLGLLMTLVLALSVQGIADAITVPAAQNAETAVTATYAIGDSISPFQITLDAARVRESVSITAPDGGIRFTVGGISASSLTLTEKNADGSNHPATQDAPGANGVFYSGNTQLTASVTIGGYFSGTGTGRRRITITDTTSARTTDPTYTKAETRTHTFYVVKSVRPTDSISFRFTKGGSSVNSQGYVTNVDGRSDFYIYSGSNDYPVTYTTAEQGRLYIKDLNGNNVALLTPGEGSNQPISSRIRVWLDANGSGLDVAETFVLGSTNVVTATISTNHKFKAAYIVGTPTLAINLVAPEGDTGIQVINQPSPAPGKYEFTGGIQGKNAGTIQAIVKDGAASPAAIPDVLVKFDLFTKTARGGYLTDGNGNLVGTIVSPTNTTLAPPIPERARTLHVRTEADGRATVTYEYGTIGQQRITVTTVGLSGKEVKAELAEARILSKKIAIDTNQKQSGTTGKFDLIVLVTDDGTPESDEVVIFRTNDGELERVSAPPILNTHSVAAITQDGIINVVTNSLGEAHVVYDLDDNTGRQEIHASIDDNTNERQEITFVVNGPADTSGGGGDGADTTTQTPALTINTSGTGATRSVTVIATNAQGLTVPGLAVTLSGTALTAPQTVVSGTATTITLPTAPADYTLQAIVPGYTVAQTTLTVAAPPQPGTLSIQRVGDRVGDQQAIRVTAQTAEGGVPSSTVLVTLTGATTPSSFTIPAGDGSRSLTVTLPSTTAAQVLTVSATGYGDDSVIVPAAGTGQQTGTPDTTRTVAGEADSIEIDGQRQRSGTVNQNIPLRVQVTDANGNGVGNVKVTFRVLAPGRGRLSQRGNGRAIQDTTDARGYASATLTPLGEGNLIVRVNAGEISPVTFIIAVGEASEAATDTGTPDTDVTPSREIRPVVQVNASQRPPMLWVDGGSIYALVGASVQKFASGVDNALNIAVGGGKVYWTEKTGDSAGTINSANLNGSNVQELASILAVPMGIAVGSDKLYWTNSRGRIQSANLDGSGITNVIPGGLEGAMDLAVAGGNAYWTQGGNVRFVNLTGQKQIRDISTGMDTANSLAIGGGKVYWTEMTGESAGTVNSANLNGTGATELASISAVPSGIAVDTARSKLYWTNSRGRIQRANLNGSGIGNVVTGLGNPGDMVSSNSITAPAATPPTTTTASKKYDVNGDGTVDNKDVDAIIVAVAAKITDAKYDVTGDGTVDINDVVAVSANQDTGAAAAPALLGTQLSSVQIDRLQEQIDLLIASNDRSPDALRILTYLQQLIVMARPEKTQLLANYPNPFNPETWIPYELATDTTVKITIYNTQGVVIRTLELGHQSAGYYTGRDRAAYWDGRNALGEQVASGIYFYQFETDALSSMRKMVILK